MKHNQFKQKSLSYDMKEIRKFCKYHLIKCSNHAIQRAKERNISFDDIYFMLLMPTSTIVQCIRNKDNSIIRYVVFLKNIQKKLKYHVIIQKNTKYNGATNYEIVTLYKPDSRLFREDGRLRKKFQRLIYE